MISIKALSIVVALFILLPPGCKISDNSMPPGPDPRFGDPTRAEGWKLLPCSYRAIVDEANRSKALALLADKTAIEIDPVEAENLKPGGPTEFEVKWFLVKCRVVDLSPVWTDVYFNQLTKSLYILSGHYRGEFLFSSLQNVDETIPILVRLTCAPELVHSEWVTGGDAIFRGGHCFNSS